MDDKHAYPDSIGKRAGLRIASELEARGWTQGQLAANVHCSQPVISDLLIGKTKEPRPSLLIKIAKALGLPLADLFQIPDSDGPYVPAVAFDSRPVTRAEFEELLAAVEELQEAQGLEIAAEEQTDEPRPKRSAKRRGSKGRKAS